MPVNKYYDPSCKTNSNIVGLMMKLIEQEYSCDTKSCFLSDEPKQNDFVGINMKKNRFADTSDFTGCEYYIEYATDQESWDDETFTLGRLRVNQTLFTWNPIGVKYSRAGCGVDTENLGAYYEPEMKFILPDGYDVNVDSSPIVDTVQTDGPIPDQVVTDTHPVDAKKDSVEDIKVDADAVIADTKDAEDLLDLPDVPKDVKFDADGLDVSDMDYLDGEVFETSDASDASEVDVPPSPEQCNGLDDDGDNEIDEPEDLNPPLATIQDGICEGLRMLCLGEQGWHDPIPLDIYDMGLVENFEPVEYTCDNLDNDCDGAVDESFGVLECGVGVCYNVVPECVNGVLSVCVPKSPEVGNCDNEDDDCDGFKDEEDELTNPPVPTKTEGVCAEYSAQVCVSGFWQDPNFSQIPNYVTNEVSPANCDGADNDCDGQIDEGCVCTDGQTQPCGPTYLSQAILDSSECQLGEQACESGSWGPCVGAVNPAAEKCDDLDHDCDGSTHDGFPMFNTQCSAGQGMCESLGAYVCNASGTGTVCNAVAGTPEASEKCDDLDHDCDGNPRNGFPNYDTPCTAGEGVCQSAGVYVCTTDGLGTECGAVPGDPDLIEMCDDIDHDCDGNTHNGFNFGESCVSGFGVCESAGTYICNMAGTDTICNAPQITPPVLSENASLCDGLDNDCDGHTDNAVQGIDTPKVSQACYTGVPASTQFTFPCHTGLQYCVGGTFTGNACQGEVTPQPEKCDNIDQDCDGNTKNGFSVGTACTNGELGECLETGVTVCTTDGTGTECNAPAGVVGTETCNNLDDDCDGTADNNLTAPAADKQDGVCQGSVKDCDGINGWIEPDYSLISGYEAGAETLCDLLDNNCNGTADEGLVGATFMKLCAQACPTYYLTQIYDQNTTTSYSGNTGPTSLYAGLELLKSCDNGNKTITLATGSCAIPDEEIVLEPDPDLCNMFNYFWRQVGGNVCSAGYCFSSIAVDPFANVTKFNFCADNGTCDTGSVSDSHAYFNAGAHACQAPYDATCN